MLVDPKKPVTLRKMLVDPKTGNIYIPLTRSYQPGELPLHLVTDANCLPAPEVITGEVGIPVIAKVGNEPAITLETSTEAYKATTAVTKNLAPEGLNKTTVDIGGEDPRPKK